MKTSLSRRALLATGLTAATLMPLKARAGTDSPTLAEACVLVPEQELGPYYIGDELVRSDIREGKPGVPLDLTLQVLDVRTCRPLADAAVDLWHCDAAGVYSGFGRESMLPPDDAPPDGMLLGLSPDEGAPPLHAPGDAKTFLRGIQLTDRDGVARFRTIFPGCYPGRTNHIHFKVRTDGARAGTTYRGGRIAHTGQIFFPEAIAAPLMQAGAYAAHKIRRTTQAEDGVFTRQNGRASTARLAPVLATEPERGFEAVLVAAVNR